VERARHYFREREEECKRVWEFFGEPGPNPVQEEEVNHVVTMWEPKSWIKKKKTLHSLNKICFVGENRKEPIMGMRRLFIDPQKEEMSLLYSFKGKRARVFPKGKFYHNGFWTTTSLRSWEKAVFGAHVDFDAVSFLMRLVI